MINFIYLFLITYFLRCYDSKLSFQYKKQITNKNRLNWHHRYLKGGNISPDDDSQKATNSSVNVIVSTSIGSTFLDKKKKFTMLSNQTVLELKHQISQKFPGSPPIALQRVYYGTRTLNDSQIVSNISNFSPVPILLDMICGTSVYNKTLSVKQALEGYVATMVQQVFIANKLKSLYSHESVINEDNMESQYFRDMFNELNATIYEKYYDDIIQALKDEKNPEMITTDTIAWRNQNSEDHQVNALLAALAKEFDLNGQGVVNFAYFSIILGIIAYFGASSNEYKILLLCSIPLLWISKFRQLRLISKILRYMLLIAAVKIEFLMPLLPAPLQTMAMYHKHWMQDVSVVDEEDDEIVESDVDEVDMEVDNESSPINLMLVKVEATLRDLFQKANQKVMELKNIAMSWMSSEEEEESMKQTESEDEEEEDEDQEGIAQEVEENEDEDAEHLEI